MDEITKIQTEEDFENIISSKKMVLIIFSAPWCGNCKMIAPKLKKLNAELSTKKFYSINATELQDLAMELNVQTLPHFRIYKEKDLIGEYTGSKWISVEEFIKTTLTD